MEDKEKNLLQQWLDKLQQESWQLELLISGFAILGLFNLKEFIFRQMGLSYANYHSDLSLQVNYMVLVVIFLVTQIFITNLLIHILVRGLWIGAIGLRYVSGDIDYGKLKYNDRIIKYYRKSVGSFDKYIISLERISSVIFSFTFLLFFVLISFFMFFALTVLLSFAFKRMGFVQTDLFINIFNIVWLVLFGLVVFDFITIGLLKRIKQKHFAKFYLGLYKIVGGITLSFLWRPLLLNFLDQKYTKRLLIGVVPYMLLISFVFPNSHINEYEYFLPSNSQIGPSSFTMSSRLLSAHTFNKKYYDNMRDKDNPDFTLVQSISLPSNKVKGNLFEIFVKYTINTERYLKHQDSTLIKLGKMGFYSDVFGVSEYPFRTRKEKKKEIKEFLKKEGEGMDEKREKAIQDSLYRVFSQQDKVAYAKNILRIKGLVKEGISFFIDDQPISDSLVSLDFYIHPNAGEKGMLCFFPIDLSLGRHTLGYQKISPNRKTSVMDTFKLTIPFIYAGE